MSEIDPVILRLVAENRQYQSDMRGTTTVVQAQLDKQGAAVERLEGRMDSGFRRIGASAKASERLISGSMGALKGALAGVSAIALARSFLSLADEAKGLDATLRLATQGFGTFGQAQEDVARIANETRTGLVETGKLYANFVRGAKELGASQAEASRATETFSKTLQISGASTAEAGSATLQFGQALAAGALRGDELNSILEASPRLARLLAESMGQPIGQIKKLGEEGKLTSDKLLAALTDKKFTAGIDAEFKQMPVTFDQAMTLVNNAAITTFGAFDRGGEFSTALANFVTDGSDGFADLADKAEQTGIEIRATFVGLADAFEPVRSAGGELFDFLAGESVGFGETFRQEIRRTLAELDALRNFDLKFIGDEIKGRADYTPRPGGMLESFDKSRSTERTRLEGNAQQRKIDALFAGYDRMGNPLPGTPGAPAGRRPPAASSGKKPPKAPKSKLDPEAFAREEASLNDAILRYKGEEVVNVSDRAKIELDRITASSAAAAADINADQRLTAPQKEKLVALTKQVSALQAAAVVAERDKALSEQRLDILQAEILNDRDLVASQAGIADTREERERLEMRLLDLAYEQERSELDAVIASQASTQAQKDIAAARLAVLGQIKANEAEAIGRQYESPLEQRRRDVRETAANMGDAIENIELDAIDRLTDGLADASAEYIKLGGIAGDVINSIIRDMVKLAAQQSIFGGAKSLLGGLFGAGAGVSIDNSGSISALEGIFSKVPGFARGTKSAPGGLAWVGEDGPELVNLPKGSQVIPNNMIDTAAARSMTGARAASPAAAQRQVVVVQVQANDYFDAKVKEGAASVAVPVGIASGMQSSQMTEARMGRSARNKIP